MRPHERRPAPRPLRTDTTLPRLMEVNAQSHGDLIAFREKAAGIWQQTSWREALETTLQCAAGLQARGLGREQALLVMGDNRPRLYMGMLAASTLAAYATPVYPDATIDEIMHVVQNLHVRFALAEDQEQVDKVLELRERGATIEHIIYDDPRGLVAYEVPGLVSWSTLTGSGAERLAADPGLREALLAIAGPEDPAVFIHSSGTTGRPKGVVLSHRNVLAGVRNAHAAQCFDFGEQILSYLPMAWVGDFAISVGAAISLMFTINIPERQETALQNLREIAPTCYLAAPRSWDNMLTMVQVRMEDSTRLKKWLYDFFMSSAIAAERRKLEGLGPTTAQRLLRPIGEWVITGPIKDQLGLAGLRYAYTGGEAMGEDTFVFYRALGVRLRQLYGQTEASAFNAMHAPDEIRLHTVGRPLPGVEARIAESGEIMLRSESVFSGYWHNEEATRATLEDGWLHTGDAGYIEPDGQLVVLGRLSEVVHTAAGERYIPNYIENRLKFSPFVRDVAVLGKGREMLAAIVCIDREPVGHWAETHGISYVSYADLSQKPEVLDLIAAAIRHVNATLAEPLQLRRFVSLHKEFDADDGEITRTRKLRRNVVEERYAPIIDAIYAGADSVTMRAQIVYENGEIGVTERQLAIREP